MLGSVTDDRDGFMLYFPVITTRFLPGEIIPAALMAHSNEGLLAFLVVITWHIYNAHFSPDVFPFDVTIFNGKMSVERMEKEHPLEYERIRPDEEQEQQAGTEALSGARAGSTDTAQAGARSD